MNTGSWLKDLGQHFAAHPKPAGFLVAHHAPGRREYADSDNLPEVKNGLGIVILSTSRGVMSDKEARRFGVGGEVLATVF